MVLVGENINHISIQCERCNKILKFHKDNFNEISSKHCVPNTEIKCHKCGESTTDIIYLKGLNSTATKLANSLDVSNVKCPQCGYHDFDIVKRGWKITAGLLGSSKNERVCKKCLHKW